MKIANPTLSRFKRQNSTSRDRIFITASAAIVIGIILLGYYSTTVNKPLPTPVQNNEVLVNRTITINRSGYKVQFAIPKGAFNAQVAGTFTTQGGGIRVLIMNETDFDYWQNNHVLISPNFDSGLSISGNITATLASSETYYLVYENNASSLKTITTEVSLSYYSF